MRMLVTGGAGFIGSHYVRTLLAGGYPSVDVTAITVLDKLTYAGNLANLEEVAADPRLSVVVGDVCDPVLLAQVVPGHDAVVNFAAETHVDRSIVGAADFVLTNVVGVQTLLDACLQARTPRVLQVSTDEVYGSIEEGRFTEDSPLRPSSPYSAAKAGGDLLARAYAVTHGLDVRVTRSGNTYGPYQFPEKLVPRFLTALLAGRRVGLYGDGLHVRQWLHVDDHCNAVQLVLERGQPGGVYNVGGGAELTNRDLTQRLLDACGAGWDSVDFVPDRKGHDRRYAVDDGPLRALGYATRVEVGDGLAATVRWYHDNRGWWEPLLERGSTAS